jgi:NADH:ubiquinone oxidoreductase subunit F (NADH-binding)
VSATALRADAIAADALPLNSAHRLLPRGSSEDSSWPAHLDRYGPLPELEGRRRASLLDELEQSGLTGRGGAGFPTAVKLRTVEAGRSPVVVANGTEGEPASSKDEVLLTFNPHLVIDGVLAALAAVGGDEAYLAVGRGARRAHSGLSAALQERRRDAGQIELVSLPERFVAGEESALVHWLNGGDAKPTFTPPRPFERGVRGRPTLVQNVETLADLALVARYGADWFRERGTHDEPGTVLVTARGAVRRPGVVEVELGSPIGRILERCGGPTATPRALLVGGYFGTWIDAQGSLGAPLSDAGLRPLGATLGARTIAVLPQGACGLAETSRIVRYLAGESAGQCGPCVFGLPAVADALESIVTSSPDARRSLERLPRLAAQIAHRGACGHPDGVLRLVDSALRVFAPELELHMSGRCGTAHRAPLLPTSPETTDWR